MRVGSIVSRICVTIVVILTLCGRMSTLSHQTFFTVLVVWRLSATTAKNHTNLILHSSMNQITLSLNDPECLWNLFTNQYGAPINWR